VGVAIDTSDRCGFRIGVMAVTVQFALAEETGAAKNVERDQDVISNLEILDRRADFFHNAGKLVSKGRADPRVRD
jgi:hypothetical protein